MLKRVFVLAALLLLLLATPAAAQEVTSALYNYGPNSDYRWLDVADQAYAGSYMSTYTYDQATVELTYNAVGEVFVGSLMARNLKPNFAYQLKLVADAGSASGELLGLTGRWWEQVWQGTDWSTGWNLNNKGDGSSPNPNDSVYNSRKNIVDATSDTGLKYKYTGYRVFEYFITDENGDADIAFAVTSSYHVLWRTDQAHTRAASDGPLVSRTFDPNPISNPAYDNDYGQKTATVYGEWERLPMAGVPLLPGTYTCQVMLTEESFHGSGLAGYWAAAMVGDLSFTILSPSTGGSHLVILGNGQEIASGDLTPSDEDHTDFGKTNYRDGTITRTFTIRNDGTGAATVLGISTLGPDKDFFTVLTAPTGVLAPGETANFKVSFDPNWKGNHVATIVVSANDGGARHYTFAVSGSGFESAPWFFYYDKSDGGGCAIGRPQGLDVPFSSFGLWPWALILVSALAGRRIALIRKP